MPLITTADERAKGIENVKIAILGEPDAGKTTLARTIEAPLVLDCESGMLALKDSGIDSINIPGKALETGQHPFGLLEDLVCIAAGPSANVTNTDYAYSRHHHSQAVERWGNREQVFGGYKTLFIDSLTEITRFAFSAAKADPQAKTDKGKLDTRGAYGLLGQWMVGADGMLNRLKHIHDMNVVVVGILELDNFEGIQTWQPQVEGGKTAKELMGIFDVVATLAKLPMPDGAGTYRGLVCQGGNRFGFPAKDRSGQLDEVEPPDLGAVLQKIRGDRKREIVTSLPEGFDAPATAPASPTSW